MGGHICLRIAMERPDLVSRLALVAPAVWFVRGSLLARIAPLVDETRQFSPCFMATLSYDALRAGPITLLRSAHDLLQHEVGRDLGAIRAPTLLIWGEHDAIVPVSVGYELRQLIRSRGSSCLRAPTMCRCITTRGASTRRCSTSCAATPSASDPGNHVIRNRHRYASNTWIFDELRHAGDEHLDPAYGATYDRKAAVDPAEDLVLLRSQWLSAQDTLVDFGAGTGTFALAAAPFCKRIVAVDVSPAMLTALRARAERLGVTNIEYAHAGFLSYQHTGDPADAV